MLRAVAGCAKPRGVDEQPAFKRHRRIAAGVEFDAASRRPGVQQRRMKSADRAGVLGVAAQRQHVGMAVDDAGGRRQQRRIAIQRRLQCAGLRAGKGPEIVDAIGLGMRPDRLQLLGFAGRGRDDQLAAIAVWDAVIPAILVERALAAHAHPGHQAARLVIDAGVDHLAVAGGGHRADRLGRLQQDHLPARLRQPPRHRETDHARTDNDALNLVHSRLQAHWNFNVRFVRWPLVPGQSRPRNIA